MVRLSSFRKYAPRLFQILATEGYTRKDFLSDLIAGVTVGLVALPLAMAFGIASGVKPEQGIYTAIVAGFVMSFFGGSRVQIGGPTGAFVIVISGIIGQFGLSGLWMVTAMAGLIGGNGLERLGQHGALHSPAYYHRLYQWHCHSHRLHTN